MRALFLSLTLWASFGLPAWTSDGLRSLAHQLADGLDGKKSVALGILNFPYEHGRTSTGSHLVSERLLTYLVQDGQTVIERRFIETILEQKMLWECGLTDPQSIKKLAIILGADAIVVGTLSDVSDNSTEVIARIIKVDGAEILSAASVTIPRLWLDSPKVPSVAQVSVPVPTAALQIGTMFQQVKTAPVTAGETRRHYNPSPVPIFSIPSSGKVMGGHVP